jgi:four helix bundle protein
LAVSIFELTSKAYFRRYRSVRDQIERAAMSVSNNISEGFERGTIQETLTFPYIARGSCGETRSIPCLSERLPGFSDLRSEILDLRSKSESVSRQLRAWANSLQNTSLRGQRYLTEKSRRLDKQRKEREEFLKELEEIRNRKT